MIVSSLRNFSLTASVSAKVSIISWLTMPGEGVSTSNQHVRPRALDERWKSGQSFIVQRLFSQGSRFLLIYQLNRYARENKEEEGDMDHLDGGCLS